MGHGARVVVAIVAAFGAADWVRAQSELVPPRALAAPDLPQPTNAQGTPVEGWVTVRYAVLADGTPANIRVIDVMPPSIDPAAAVESFERRTFSPATDGGEAIDWHNNETVMVFKAEAGPEAPEPSSAFEDGHAAVAEMIEAKDFEGALDLNRDLLNERSTGLGEIGLALYHMAVIQIGRLDFHAALEAVRQATDPRVPTLGSADLFGALQLRMQLEDQLGRVREAMESHERLVYGIGDAGPNAWFARIGEDLELRWESAEFIQVTGRIDDGAWRFDPGRRTFTVDAIEGGEIDGIDAECDTRTASLPYQSGVDWQLPESFGECTLLVRGDPGTTFAFYELPPVEE